MIGAGSWVNKAYLPVLEQRVDEVAFVAAAAFGEQRQALLRNRWKFDHVSSDYQSVLDHDLDICIVASPASFHFEHAMAALDAGCHVLVEKPFTVSPAEAWKLCEVAKVKDRELVVAFGWNYLPMIRDSQDLLSRSSGIGQVETLSLYMASGLREMLTGRGAYPDASQELLPDPKTWSDPSLSGGGYGAGQLSHIFALMSSVLGTRVEEVFSLMVPEPSGERVELHDAALLRLAGGGIGAVVGSAMYSGAGKGKHQVEIRVVGTKGQFHLDLERERSSYYSPVDGSMSLALSDGAGTYECTGPPNALVEVAFGRREANLTPGTLGAEVVEIVSALYESQKMGDWCQVGLRPSREATIGEV